MVLHPSNLVQLDCFQRALSSDPIVGASFHPNRSPINMISLTVNKSLGDLNACNTFGEPNLVQTMTGVQLQVWWGTHTSPAGMPERERARL